VRPGYDSIALPVNKWLRDQTERQQTAEVRKLREEIIGITVDLAMSKVRLDNAVERLTRLESTEERAPLER
jgi:hypothetical protein